jgi:hypothetical protein
MALDQHDPAQAEYTVRWEIDHVSAASPAEAARQALEIQRDPASIATVFTVVDSAGTAHEIDLG